MTSTESGVPERSSDFAVGDEVSLTNKREGTIKWIGTIDGIGTPCFGIELKDGSNANGNGTSQDGVFNGQKYFDCEPGKGTFVARAKIISRIKAAVESSTVTSPSAKSKKGTKKKGGGSKGGSKGASKSPRPGGRSTTASARGRGKSPRPASSRGGKNDKKSATRKTRDAKSAQPAASGKPVTPKPTVSFNIPENATLEEKINFILERLSDCKSPFKGRQKMLKTLSEIVENEEKIDETQLKNAIEGFRKPFVAQLAGKRVTIHQAAMDTLTVIAKTHSDEFAEHGPFYIKKLLGHCKHSDPKSVAAAEKTIQTIVKETKDKSLIAATMIQTATHAKNKIIRKHAWQFLNETLKYYLPAKGQKATPPPKEILDALASGLKNGLAESDRHTKEEAMHVLNTLGLFDETRAERLISKLPATQRRQYQSKFEKRTSSSSKLPGVKGSKKTDSKSDKRSKPARAATAKTPKKVKSPSKGSAKKPAPKGGSKGSAKKPSSTKPSSKGSSKTEKKPASGKGTKSKTDTTASKEDGSSKDSADTTVVANGKANDSSDKTSSKEEANGSAKTEANGSAKTGKEAGDEKNDSKKAEANGKTETSENGKKEESGDKDGVSSDLAKKRAEKKAARRGNKGSLMGSEDDDALTAALKIEFPGLGDGSNESDENPISPDSGADGAEKDQGDNEDSVSKSEKGGSNEDEDNSEDIDDTNDVVEEENVGDNDDNESSSTSSSEEEPLTQDPNTAIELIESFLELKDPQINWKMIEFLSKDNMTHLLMSYISRMPGGPKIWTENLDVDFDEVIPPTKALSSEEETEIRATRLSYSLMRILSNEHAAETVKSFLLRKCQEICLHALAVFHPRSKGNVYHGRVVLEILLNDWPKSFMGALANQKHIQKLLKCALFRNLHQGNLNSFFLDLICYRPTAKTQQLQPIKRKLLKLFSDWQFMEYLLDAACSPKHGDDVATKYATFFIDLVARSASIPEAAELFHGHEHLIIDSFMNALLDDDQTRTLWHRIICGQTLVQFLDISSRPNIMDPAAAMAGVMGIVPEPSPNVLHLMFEKSLERLHTFIPRMCKAIQSPKEKLEAITLSGGIVEKPFGQVRLNCLELLTVSADFAQFGCGKVLGKLTNDFWKSILDMAFIHETNNMYLCHFRRLIHLSMIFRRRFLKFLFVECKMLERFVEFYQTPNKNRATLHGYVLQMLWDIYHHDQREDDDNKIDNNNNGDGKDNDNDSNSSVIVNDGEKGGADGGAGTGDDDADKDGEQNKDKDEKEKEKKEKEKEKEKENVAPPPSLDMNEDKKDEEEYTEEDLILRPNFSREPEDQWDIVSFFKSNDSWKAFEKVLTQEIEIQNNADTQLPNPMGAGGDGQLDALLQNLLGPSNGDDNDNGDDDDDDDSSSDDSSD